MVIMELLPFSVSKNVIFKQISSGGALQCFILCNLWHVKYISVPVSDGVCSLFFFFVFF